MATDAFAAKRIQRVAVVTGGAAGIGQAYAVRLAQDGHKVAIADITPAEETAELIRKAGGEVFYAHCDVSDAQSVTDFMKAVTDTFGRVDILVHNAGIYPLVTFEGTSWATWRKIMDVNLDSAFHLTQAVLPGMKQAGWGRIIMMASSAFHLGVGMVAYTASKGAIIGMVRALASEVGVDGVTINAIAPGLVRTPGTTAGGQDEVGGFEFAKSVQAIKRSGAPEDLVGAVSFLSSADSAFMTGQTLVVDGGWARV